MDATVSRIVDLLFEDVVMTEETNAIHDEVMNNCQERFDSLIADGYSEDDAIGAVVESLKGMDEVLKDYAKKEKVDDAGAFRKTAADAYSQRNHLNQQIQWDAIDALQIKVQSADVEVLLSKDGTPDMELRHGTRTALVPRTEGSTLIITQEKKNVDAEEIEAEDSGSFWGRLGRAIAKSVVTIGDSEAKIILRIPANMLRTVDIQSLSGDISMYVPCGRINLQTASGDIYANLTGKNATIDLEINGKKWSNLPEGILCENLNAKSISCDVNIAGNLEQATLNTTSGDIEFRGSAAFLQLNTVSGDADADFEGNTLKANSVSGDLHIYLKCGESADVQLNTVSGDADIRFPDYVKAVCAKTGTRSGNVEYHGISLMDDAPVRVKCSSVSGDISIG